MVLVLSDVYQCWPSRSYALLTIERNGNATYFIGVHPYHASCSCLHTDWNPVVMTGALISLYTSAARIHTSRSARLICFASCQRNVPDASFDCATIPIVLPKKESLKRPGVFCAKGYSSAGQTTKLSVGLSHGIEPNPVSVLEII
jgi:hypothetical protein